MVVCVSCGLLIRVLQIAERVRVDLIGGSQLFCFEYHLNLVFAFNESPQEINDAKGTKTHVLWDCIAVKG
jgi:hypothetical protein